jgi:hypothetical protein
MLVQNFENEVSGRALAPIPQRIGSCTPPAKKLQLVPRHLERSVGRSDADPFRLRLGQVRGDFLFHMFGESGQQGGFAMHAGQESSVAIRAQHREILRHVGRNEQTGERFEVTAEGIRPKSDNRR